MDKFLIGFGLAGDAETGIVYAHTQRDAYAAAVERTRAKGWAMTDPDELEETWAKPFDEHRARDLGLRWLDEGDQWVEAGALRP